MKIILASDHAGFELKNKIKDFLNQEGFQVEDLGAHVYEENDNYPELILPAAMRVISDPVNIGAIVFGKSGQGEAIICNRLPGARAVVYYGQNLEIIRLAREHNNSNILSIGAGFVGFEEAREAIRLWISTPFSNEKRHVLRNEMLDTIE